jgi:two-component system cell cycle response regulator DivK
MEEKILVNPSADLPQSIEQAIEETVGVAGDKPVSVIAEYPAHLPAVTGELNKLVDVMVSLIELAASVTESGEIRITAEILSPEEIPNEIQASDLWPESGPFALIQVSYRGDQPDQAAASRLSFAKCQELIRDYDGQLWNAVVATGPRFIFTLPIKAMRPDITNLRHIVQSHLLESEQAGSLLLVLVREDDLRDAITADLLEAGHQVISTGDGAEIVGLARKERPDLIVLDMVAREPASLDIAALLKQDKETQTIPVLFLTSVDEEGVRMGAVDFLVRPLGTGALLSTINAVLESGINPSGRVLVADPDDADREMMALMIQEHGYRVTEAARSEEALAIAEHVPPELILVNAKLAADRDYWLLRGLRQLDHSFDIYVLADALTEAEGQAAVDRGASGFSETGQLGNLLDQVRLKRTGSS